MSRAPGDLTMMIETTLPHAASLSTVGSLFRDRARLDPDRPAIEAAGRTFTYRQVDDRVNRRWRCCAASASRAATGSRSKYMIKSGGENIYPAEIERVLLADSRIADAVVVRRPDPRWGEVPVAVVARKDDTLASADLYRRCRAELAGYKQPKEIVFVALAELPRSTTGEIQRYEVEAWLKQRAAG